MAPNASPFFNFNLDNHAVLIRQNIRHQFNCNNNTSTLLKTRLKLIKENFALVNSYFLKEPCVETVINISPSPSPVCKEKNEFSWLDDERSINFIRFELIRKMMVKQTIKDKMEAWQKKRDEMLRNKRPVILFKSKFQRDDILVKKENYKLILEQIQQRKKNEQTIEFNHQQRSREICFKAVLAKAVIVINIINNYFDNQQLVLNVGKQIDIYHSMESRLDILKNVKVVGEASLVAAQSLLTDLTLYKNDVVLPIQAEIETIMTKKDEKKNPLNFFSVNIPQENVMKQVRRQYVALVKNNKALIKNLTEVKQLPFISDPTTKVFRQNLIKVINTLVNTISSTNAAHLTEKYNKLNALLSGKLVSVANTQVIIGSNKEALSFCMETLASKIISYAEEVICVKTQAAYEIAAVIVKLWSVHQQFGKILFAEIKEKCPLLVPFCYPVARPLTVEQFDYKSFGYKVDSSGKIESHNNFLKRMIGIVRLYAALIVTSSKHDQPIIGLGQAWIFVAGTINQNPVADITATMLVEFLNIVGFEMHQMYGKQFIKLLQYINTHYLKKITLITPAGYGGPITRLNSFLSRSLCIGSIEEPKGLLPSDFL